MNFTDFTDGSSTADGDYIVGYAAGGGAGSDRRWLRSALFTATITNGLTITPPALSSAQGADYKYNSNRVVLDAIDNTGNNTIGSYVEMVSGGATAKGQKVAFYSLMTQFGASTDTGGDFIGGQLWAIGSNTNGGTNTSSGAKGTFYGIAALGHAFSGALNYLVVSGGECNAIIGTGASAKHRWGWSIVGNGDLRGAGSDAALQIGAATAAGAFTYGVLFSTANSQNPLPSTGVLMGGDGASVTITDGLNFSSYTFTGNIFNFPTFKVSGAGVVTLSGLTNAANDGAAASGGVAVGQVYHNAGALRVRLT